MKNYLFVLLLLLAGYVQAHGDDDHKDHGHAAPGAVLETNAVVPTLTSQSEVFELVARLYSDELGIYIDHWASNMPLLNASVEVELNGRKAIAQFHPDHGDYAVADPDMVKALHAEGEHALIFTITSGKDADLLTGELHVHADDAMSMLTAKPLNWLFLAGVGSLILIGCALALRHLLRARKEERA